MEATDPISITLAARDWNTVITALHEMPKRIADPLIATIAEQARAATAPPVPSDPIAAPPIEMRGNEVGLGRYHQDETLTQHQEAAQ